MRRGVFALGLLVVGAILTGRSLIATGEPCIQLDSACSSTACIPGTWDFGALECVGEGCCTSGGGRRLPV
jgi:hypothetical protein